MSPTETILAMALSIIRTYAISFLLLPFNIFSTYYFQAILQPKAAFIVSVARGLVISGALILMLPLLAGADSLWFAMPITELVTAVYAAACIRRYTARLDAKSLDEARPPPYNHVGILTNRSQNVTMQLDRPRGQMSDSFLMSAFIILSGGLQDAYTYCCRDKVFANAQTGNIVLMSTHLLQATGQMFSAILCR